LERADRAAQRAAELTNQMLAYSGKGRFVVGPVDLSHLVEELLPLLATVLSKRAVVTLRLAKTAGGRSRRVTAPAGGDEPRHERLGRAPGWGRHRGGGDGRDGASGGAGRNGPGALLRAVCLPDGDDSGCGMDAETPRTNLRTFLHHEAERAGGSVWPPSSGSSEGIREASTSRASPAGGRPSACSCP